MIKFNPDIHKRKSIRLKHYDYSQKGLYFITICTKDRENIFGKIISKKMVLNSIGKIVEDELKETLKIRDNVKIENYVIMPNHIHVIVEKLNSEKEYQKEIFGKSRKNSIASIIRSYKSSVTSKIRKLEKSDIFIVWQRGFHDHIIRDEKIYYKIKSYIKLNPEKWKDDMFFRE